MKILDSETTWSFVDINSQAKFVILTIAFFIFRRHHLIVGIHRIGAWTKVIVRRKWAPWPGNVRIVYFYEGIYPLSFYTTRGRYRANGFWKKVHSHISKKLKKRVSHSNHREEELTRTHPTSSDRSYDGRCTHHNQACSKYNNLEWCTLNPSSLLVKAKHTCMFRPFSWW